MSTKTILIAALFTVIAIVAVLFLFINTTVALGLVIGLTVVLIVFSKPFYGLIIYIILIYVMPQVFIPTLQKFRIMLLMAVLILLVFFVHKIVRKEHISFIPTRQSLLMFIILLIVPISNIVNFQLKASWDGFNTFLTVFMLYFLITNLIKDISQFRKVCWTLIICTTLLSLNGLLMYFRGYDIVGNTPLVGRIRWMSHFGDPNDFALAITSILPFTLVKLFSGNVNRMTKILLSILMVIFTSAIVFTESRGGYIAFLLILGIFALKKWGLVKGIIIGIIFIAFAFVIAPSRMGDLDPYGQSAGGRVHMWIGGLVLLKQHPVFGIGFGNFTSYMGRASHSAFIQCLAEMGLVGYFFWIALLYTCFMDIRTVEATDASPYKEYSLALQLSLIGFLGGAVFLSQAYSPMLYIILALITITAHSSEKPIRRPRILMPSEALKIIIIMGLSIVGYKLLAMVY